MVIERLMFLKFDLNFVLIFDWCCCCNFFFKLMHIRNKKIQAANVHDRIRVAQLAFLGPDAFARLVAHRLRADAHKLHSRPHESWSKIHYLYNILRHMVLLVAHRGHVLLSTKNDFSLRPHAKRCLFQLQGKICLLVCLFVCFFAFHFS